MRGRAWGALCAAWLLTGAAEPPTVVIRLGDTVRQREAVERLREVPADLPVIVSAAILPAAPGRQPPTDTAEKPIAKRFFDWFRSDPRSGQSLTILPTFERVDERRQRGKRLAYEDQFRKYAKHYFGVGTDWRWFAAQAQVESEMKPGATSRSGAMGLMQIMPKTFQEIRRTVSSARDPFDPLHSIAAGIYYNRQLYKASHLSTHYNSQTLLQIANLTPKPKSYFPKTNL
mgnify:CR=1 FL=1